MLRKEDRIRKEIRIDSQGWKRTGYIHLCKMCGIERWIRLDWEKFWLEHCKVCEPKFRNKQASLKNPIIIKDGIEYIKCLTCEIDQELNNFRNFTGYSNKCKKCSQLTNNFGISNREYQDMLKKQKNVCAICKLPESAINTKSKQLISLSVDHCHKTGVIRGLLCSQCNIALGGFKDNETYLKGAIKYLRKSRK